MAAKTLYLKDAAASGSAHGSLQDGGSAPGTATTGTGWTVAKTAATVYSLQVYGTERAANTFGATAMPNAAPSTTDSWRSESLINGSFADTAWTIRVSVIAVGTGGSQDGRMRFRLYRSTNADGSGATQITSGTVQLSVVTNLATSAAQVSSGTVSPGVVTLTDEYLFLQLAWELTGAGGNNNCDVLIRTNSADSVITTPEFTPGEQSLTVPLLQVGTTFFTPTVDPAEVNLVAPLLQVGTTFFTPTVDPDEVDLVAPLLQVGTTFFTPTVEVSSNEQALTAPLLQVGTTFFAPTVDPDEVDLVAPLLQVGTTFFAPAIDPDEVDLVAPLLQVWTTFFAPTVAQVQELEVPLLQVGTTFFAPTIDADEVDLVVPLLQCGVVFFPPTVTQVQELEAPLLQCGVVFFPPTVTQVQRLEAPLLQVGATLFTPVVGNQLEQYLVAPLLQVRAEVFPPLVLGPVLSRVTVTVRRDGRPDRTWSTVATNDETGDIRYTVRRNG